MKGNEMKVVYVNSQTIVALEGTDVLVATPHHQVRLELLEAVHELSALVPEDAEREVCRELAERGVSCH